MDVSELLSFKPTTAPKRPAASDDLDEVEEADDPRKLNPWLFFGTAASSIAANRA